MAERKRTNVRQVMHQTTRDNRGTGNPRDNRNVNKNGAIRQDGYKRDMKEEEGGVSRLATNRKRYHQNEENKEKDNNTSTDASRYVRNEYEPKYPHKKRCSRRRRQHRRSSSSSPMSSSDSLERPTGVVSEDEECEFPRAKNHHDSSNYGRRSKPRRRASRSASGCDDTVGHFRGTCGTIMADRYRVIGEVGIGTFGRVLECVDLSRRSSDVSRYAAAQYVAIKVVRSVKRYCDSAIVEAKIVAELNRCSGRGMSHCVVLRDSFSLDNHYCLVFERLGPSLYDFLKRHNYQPFPMVCIQDFTVQLLETLEFIHSLRLIHTDLKIENILLMDYREVSYGAYRVPASTKIKIIDFGGACYDNEKKSTIITTRQYRAPEVILGTGWSMPSDMWSTGCILAELYQGELLFATKDNIEHLALMEQCIGYFPRYIVKEARSNQDSNVARQAFNSSCLHRMERTLDPDKFAFVRRMPRLDQIVRNPHDGWFLGLLKQILDLDPKQRATAHECLRYLARYGKNVSFYT